MVYEYIRKNALEKVLPRIILEYYTDAEYMEATAGRLLSFFAHQEERFAAFLGQNGASTLWMTGCSGAGKSTIIANTALDKGPDVLLGDKFLPARSNPFFIVRGLLVATRSYQVNVHCSCNLCFLRVPLATRDRWYTGSSSNPPTAAFLGGIPITVALTASSVERAESVGPPSNSGGR
jgi:hypothetical protein